MHIIPNGTGPNLNAFSKWTVSTSGIILFCVITLIAAILLAWIFVKIFDNENNIISFTIIFIGGIMATVIGPVIHLSAQNLVAKRITFANSNRAVSRVYCHSRDVNVTPNDLAAINYKEQSAV